MMFEWLNVAVLALTIVAIVYGPIKAVQISQRNEDLRWARERKLAVLRDLMKTRGMRLDPVHVAALNVIEVEFYGDDAVLKSYNDYVRHLGSPLPYPDQQERYFRERYDLFIQLAHSIGHSLSFKFDKGDISRLAYSPQGWEQDQLLRNKNAELFSELLEGKRALPVLQFLPHHEMPRKSIFPSPPE
jgi:hypothetical protein